MAGSSSSYSHGNGSSYSVPTLEQSPQSEWGLQLSQLLTALGQNQYNWAMNQFNTGQGITNQNIATYMDLAGKGAGLAQNLLSRYENVFEPLMDKYIQDAGTYNSEGRQRFMMGQAESTVGQADEAAQNEAERKLQGFGINPNSGRYQDLMLTSRIQDAAARAGAGTQASLNTAAIGRQMEQTAAQMGQNVPGMTVNALQSAYTGVTGAENALLGMLNTGATLTSSAAPFLNAASGAIKMPAQGQVSASQNQQQAKSNSVQTNPPQSGGGDKGNNKQQPQNGGNKNDQQSPQQPRYITLPNRHDIHGPFQPEADVKHMPDAAEWQQGADNTDQMLRDAENNPTWMGDNMAQQYADNGTGASVDPNFPEGQDPWDPQTYAGAGGSPWWADSSNPDMTPGPLTGDFSGNWDQGQTPQTGQTDPNMPAAPQNWGGNGGNAFGGDQTDPWANATNPLANQTPDHGPQPMAFGNFPNQGQGQDQGQQDQFGGQDFSQWDNVPASQNIEDQRQNGTTPDYSQWDDPNFDWTGGGIGQQGISQDGGYQGGSDQYGGQYNYGDQQGNDQYGGDQYNYGDQGNQGGTGDEGNGGGYGAGGGYGGGGYGGGGYGGGGYGGGGYGGGGDYSGGGYYAKGGVVRPSTGGPVPRTASPTRGRVTDDVPARLNAGEFVVPRDVVKHKGTEFFSKLVQQSRKVRTGMAGAPPQPKRKPGLRMRPTFVSRGM